MASRTRRHSAPPKISKPKRRLDWQGQAAFDDWLSICVRGTPEIFRFAGSLLYDEATSIPSLPTDHDDLDNSLVHVNRDKQEAMLTVALQLIGMEKNCAEDSVMICDNEIVGKFEAFAGVKDPESGWLRCNGEWHTQAEYPELWQFFIDANTNDNAEWEVFDYENPEESGFFLPTIIGRTALVGTSPADVMHKAGLSGGSATHTLTVDEIPAHTHIVQGRENASGFGTSRLARASTTGATNDATSMATGGGEAHDNMPPYINVFWHVRATPFCFEVPVIVGRPGEPGEPGDCSDCGDNPPSVPDINDPGELPPFPDGSTPIDIPCSAVYRMVSVLESSLNELIAQAESAANIAFFLLAVITTLVGSFFAGVGVSFLRNLYTLVSEETDFDSTFWDDVRCIAYGILPPDGLFNDQLVTAFWHALEQHGDDNEDPRFNVLSGFVRVMQYNGINYLSRVDPIPEADCTDCGPPDPVNIGSFTVNSKTSGYTSSPFNSVNGKVYKLVISGNVRWSNVDTNAKSDPQYVTYDNWTTPLRTNSMQFSDGSRPDAIDPTYTPTHTYEFWRAGNGSPFALRYHDTSYSDNNGSFTVVVWEH